MFSTWKTEKAIEALVDEAQSLSDKLAAAKPHIRDSHAAAARLWAAVHLANGQNLYDLADWKPADLKRFVSAAKTKIAALRKQREYSSSDGLAIWLSTARAVTEPKIAPPVHEIWQQLNETGQNADAMAEDMLQDAGLPMDQGRRIPKGFQVED